MIGILLILGVCVLLTTTITFTLICSDREKDNLEGLVDKPDILFDELNNVEKFYIYNNIIEDNKTIEVNKKIDKIDIDLI